MLKYLIVGTGGVGGTLASCLALDGHNVDCIARGAHLEAIRTHGLRFHSHRMGEHLLRVDAFTAEVSRRKFGLDSDEVVDVVNLKQPTEMFGSFGAAEGVYPAYHMNKLHWVSVLLPDAPEDVVSFLVSVSFELTEKKKKRVQNK